MLTFGHDTATAEQLTEPLRGADVTLLIDVRTVPGNRLRRRDDGLLVYDAGQQRLL